MIATFAMFFVDMNLARRQVFMTRHGESLDNILERIGGDAPV